MRNLVTLMAVAAVLASSCASPRTERTVYRDECTGREVWQLTQIDSCMMPYFENQAFTYDDSYAVFKSNRDAGVWKLYSSDMKTGAVEKISDREVTGAWSIYSTGDEAVFMSDAVLYAVNVRTHAERVLFDARGKVAEQTVISNCLFTEDGDYTVLRACNPDKYTSLYRVRISTGEIEKLLSSPYGIQHPMINPRHPNLVTYVCKPDRRTMWNLPREERARGMLIDTDKGTVVPFVMSDSLYRATHETWSSDGERLFYFDKIHRVSDPDPVKGWEVSLVSIDRDGGDRSVHYTNNVYKLSHGVGSADGRWFVMDVERKMENPLFLFNLGTGEAEIICWPNQRMPSSGNRQSEHVHPLFSRSGRYIAFTSDRNTPLRPQAFVVPVGDITQK